MKGVLLLLATGCHDDTWLQYEWNDRRVLCSQSIDDITGDVSESFIDDQIEIAIERRSVALFHAHVPHETITIEQLTRALDTGLDFVTFSELLPGSARPAVALCFDDTAVRAWYDVRDLLDSYGARVTFFVTRYPNWTAEERGMLQELAARGHDVQPHTVDHLNAVDYADAHGIAAYVQDEVLPSIAALQADGYPTTSFAYPFGASTPELDAAVLEHVQRVRVSPGSCPH